MENNNNSKRYTFFNAVNALRSDKQGTFISVTVSGLLMKMEAKATSDNKVVVNGVIPVNGRSKQINNMLGTSFKDDETVWLNASFWEKTGERLQKLLAKINNPDKVMITAVGSLQAHEYTDKTGNVHKIAQMLVLDWELKGYNNQNSSSNGKNSTNKPESKPADTKSAEQNNVFDDNGFVMIGDDEMNDLPFEWE